MSDSIRAESVRQGGRSKNTGTKRKPISKAVRFEVFKRDQFTCQYCGAKAPDAVLHADHIEPVAKGGTNEIVNLITACEACNAGKAARRLTDREALAKQRKQLDALAERREQIEMMARWRADLADNATQEVTHAAEAIRQISGFEPNPTGQQMLRQWIGRFSFGEVLTAIERSFTGYMRIEDGRCTVESWNVAFQKIPGVVSVMRQEADRPYLRRLLYIRGILNKRFEERHYMLNLLENAVLDGVDIDDIERLAKTARTRAGFERTLMEWMPDDEPSAG